MAQLRDAYDGYEARSCAVIVVGPETAEAFQAYWKKHLLPFIGLPDPTHEVLKSYGQQVKLFKLGRMPAQVLVDRKGIVRFVHYGHSMRDIPDNDGLFLLLDRINADQQ